MEPLTVFIGSSTEARDRGIVPRLAAQLSKTGFQVTTWYDHEGFAPGEYTLDALLSVAKDVDCALLVFSKDDRVEIRGNPQFVPRDNVLLEYGLFTAQLGRRRVAVIQEEGVKLPIDVNGMGVARFASGDDGRRNATLDLAVSELTKSWKRGNVPPPPDRFADGGLGFVGTMKSTHDRLECLRRRLWGFAKEEATSGEPLDFDPKGYCVSTYAEALDKVTSRFWTTTYLSSGFWTKKQATVLDANKKMMERLENGGEARRLFLAQQRIADEVDAWREQHVLDRKLGRIDKLRLRLQQFEQLKANVAELLRAGCKVRVAYDSGSAFHMLPAEVSFKENDSEIAIYDRFRVDVFEGGSSGTISGVACYTPAMHTFNAYLGRSEAYFSQLWETGTEMSDFLEQIDNALSSASARIDYESNWLAFYEFALGPDDTNLKIVESKRVEEVLRNLGKWGKLQRCLDIGTCTGRYPMMLTAGLAEDGSVLGIDDDPDCVRFAKSNVLQKAGGDPRITIRKEDFTANDLHFDERFDLITCMLGTLSHLGRERANGINGLYDDRLQRSLERMASLLRDDGCLILGTWSEHACATRQMLGIYRDVERLRLAEWTPNPRELRARLRQAALEIVEEAHPDIRLDFTACRRAGGQP
jgi:SAM-dependent methyltransferase